MPLGGTILETNPGLVDTTFRGLRSTFETALEGGVDESWSEVAMRVPGATRKEAYRFITDMPGMKKWFGNRITEGWKIEALEIENVPYEETIEVDEFDLDDDTAGVFAPIVAQLGLEAARMPAEIVYGHLEAGFTANSYDGTTFFSDSHAFGDNKGTAALDATSFTAGLLALQSFTNSNGRKLGINRVVKLVVPLQLRAAANTIIGNQFLTDGTNNPNFGAADIVVANSLTDANNWYLIGQNGILRPLMFQERMAPRTRRNDNELFDKHKIFWGVDARWGVAYALPQMAYGATVT
jgi:phage major head subunit gpT-like protein